MSDCYNKDGSRKSACVKMDAYTIERVCEEILCGKMIAHIVAAAHIGRGELYAWLRETPERWQAYEAARNESAEGWADRGLTALETVTDPARARSIDNHCRWRAGQRNPAYRDGSKIELTGKNGGPIQVIASHLDEDL